MRKEYEVVIFERDGQQKKCNITDTELDNFNKLTGILDIPEQKQGAGFSKKRYFNLRDLAWETLLASGVNSLPVSLEKIAAANGWALLSYKRQAEAVAIIDKLELRRVREGFSCEIAGRAIICYDEVSNKGRMRWTIAHEYGHLAMKHSAAAIENYKQEANMFARRLLAPMGVLRKCEVKDEKEIAKLCAMSAEAAEYAFNRYTELLQRGKFFTSQLEVRLCEQFNDFIVKYLNK